MKEVHFSIFSASVTYWFLGFFLKVNAFPITVMFGMCSIFLFVASILQRRLMMIADKPSMILDCIYTLFSVYRLCIIQGTWNMVCIKFLNICVSCLLQRQKIGQQWRIGTPRQILWTLDWYELVNMIYGNKHIHHIQFVHFCLKLHLI